MRIVVQSSDECQRRPKMSEKEASQATKRTRCMRNRALEESK